jgi:hypothetical protein
MGKWPVSAGGEEKGMSTLFAAETAGTRNLLPVAEGLGPGFETTDRTVEVDRFEEIRDEPAVEREAERLLLVSPGNEDRYSWTRASPNVKKFCPTASAELCFESEDDPLLTLQEPPNAKISLLARRPHSKMPLYLI